MQTQSHRAIQRMALPAMFAKLLSQKVSGKLVFTHPDGESSFFFVSGRFLLAVNQSGRGRRWLRVVERYAPNLKAAKLDISHPQIPWEYQLLCQELTLRHISQQQARSILVALAQEVILPLLWREQSEFCWMPISLKTSLLAWIPFDKEVLLPMQNLAEQLLHLSPELVNQFETGALWVGPPLESMPEAARLILQELNGQQSFWDLETSTKHALVFLIRQIDKLYKRGWITFQPLVDQAQPLAEPMVTPVVASPAPVVSATVATTPTVLIACIDDSKAMCQVLEKMLVPAGYEVLKIHSPLQEMATLVSQQPQLLLLDLMMPDVDGYSLCTFLRKTPVFKDTPIIILTSSTGIIDRTRAISAGATGFLSKPPDQELLLSTIKKYV